MGSSRIKLQSIIQVKMWSLTNFGLNLRPGKCPQAKEFWFLPAVERLGHVELFVVLVLGKTIFQVKFVVLVLGKTIFCFLFLQALFFRRMTVFKFVTSRTAARSLVRGYKTSKTILIISISNFLGKIIQFEPTLPIKLLIAIANFVIHMLFPFFLQLMLQRGCSL